MRIAIIGAGFTGLSAAYELTKKDFEVVIFEKESLPGGLASGFLEKNWQWPLEKYYHHCFTNDSSILKLAEEVGFRFLKKRPRTSTFIEGKSYQLDSPLSLLLFPLLSVFQRFRMGLVLLYLKSKHNWKNLEHIKAADFLPKFMGEKAYEIVWKPLFVNKFGKYSNKIALSWFWARIKKRTTSLTYPEGGFQKFIDKLSEEIKDKGGTFLLETEVVEIKKGTKVLIKTKDKREKQHVYEFDKAICTMPSSAFAKVSPSLPKSYKEKLLKIRSLCAHNLILRLENPLLSNNTYWLNICDSKSPITGIVEHTNFIDKKHYNDEHIVYLLNYLEETDKRYSMDAVQLLEFYDPFLKKIKKDYRKDIIDMKLFKDKSVQSIIYTNYSKNVLPLNTPYKNVFLANMDHVYPWDRGTNYAISLGQEVAKICHE